MNDNLSVSERIEDIDVRQTDLLRQLDLLNDRVEQALRRQSAGPVAVEAPPQPHTGREDLCCSTASEHDEDTGESYAARAA